MSPRLVQAFPAATARETPTPVWLARLRNDETKLPDWLAIAILPGGAYGATICAHILAGVDTTPCPLGPASAMPSSWQSATSCSSAATPSGPASRYPPAAQNAAVTPLAAAWRSNPSLMAGGVQMNTMSAAPSGTSSMEPSTSSPRTSPGSRLTGNTRPS